MTNDRVGPCVRAYTTTTSDENKSESAVVSENRKTATEAADAFDTLFNN